MLKALNVTTVRLTRLQSCLMDLTSVVPNYAAEVAKQDVALIGWENRLLGKRTSLSLSLFLNYSGILPRLGGYGNKGLHYREAARRGTGTFAEWSCSRKFAPTGEFWNAAPAPCSAFLALPTLSLANRSLQGELNLNLFLVTCSLER